MVESKVVCVEPDFEVVIPDSAIDKIELERARISLLLLKNALGSEKLKEIFAEHHKTMDAQWREWVAKSNGQWRTIRALVKAHGITP